MDHCTNNTTSIKIFIFVNRNNWLQIQNIFCNVIRIKFQYQRVQVLIIQHLIQIVLYQLLILYIVFIHILHCLVVICIVIKIQVQWMVYYLALLLSIIIKLIAISMDIDSIQRSCDLIQVFMCALPLNHLIKSIHSPKQFLFSIRHIYKQQHEIFRHFFGGFFIQSSFRQLDMNSQQCSVIPQVMDAILCISVIIIVYLLLFYSYKEKSCIYSKIHHQMQLLFMLHQLNVERTIKEQVWHPKVPARNVIDVDAMHILHRKLSKLRIQHKQNAKILHSIL